MARTKKRLSRIRRLAYLGITRAMRTTTPVVKGVVWYTDRSRTWGEPGLESMGKLQEEGSASH